MRIEVEYHPRGMDQAVDLPTDATGMDLVRSLALAPDAHVLLRGETPIPEDEPLREGERIRIIAVVSGG